MGYNTYVIRVVHYITSDGTDHFDSWFRWLDSRVKARIQTRIDRVEIGNFGDYRGLGGGVAELRIDFGPGYRVYYGREGFDLVILLGGGAKDRQIRDIATVRRLWREYQREK